MVLKLSEKFLILCDIMFLEEIGECENLFLRFLKGGKLK